MREINYIDLGATLFVPAIHKNLKKILFENKYTELKSVLIDLEDGVADEKKQVALRSLEELLENYRVQGFYLFIRPSSPQMLQRILQFKGITQIDGFILPKFSLENCDEYLHILEKKNFYFMPSIEGKELFDMHLLQELHRKLQHYKKQILLVRFGLEDMLRALKMRRSCTKSIFDYCATSTVLGNFLALFKSDGFAVSGGVYPCFKDDEGFIKDVQRDLEEGLFSKTVIHPNQVKIVHQLYQVSSDDYHWAMAIMQQEEGVDRIGSSMGEKKTMYPYALEVLQRAKVYGILHKQ